MARIGAYNLGHYRHFYHLNIKTMNGKKILVGVTGGIAAYKTCELIRLLVKQNCTAKVVMTENAAKLVSPLIFEALSGNPVHIDVFGNGIDHIRLAKWADAVIVAPATANTIGKVANGIADNLLTTVVMALPETTPLFFAPAMNVNMWNNVFNQKNLDKIKLRANLYLIGPENGPLADGTVAVGRMSEPSAIAEAVRKYFENRA